MIVLISYHDFTLLIDLLNALFSKIENFYMQPPNKTLTN